MESARRAQAADIGELRRLWGEAVAELDHQRGGALLAGSLVRPDLMTFLDSILADPQRLVAVGMIDDVLVGMLSALCDRDRREPLARLEVIYVEPQARQIGVAESMVAVATEWARSMGCAGVDAPALPGNRAAKAFFETHGFVTRLLVMHLALEGEI